MYFRCIFGENMKFLTGWIQACTEAYRERMIRIERENGTIWKGEETCR